MKIIGHGSGVEMSLDAARRSACATLLGFVICLSGCSKPQVVAEKKLVYFSVDPATAGVIAGKILFTGKAAPSRTVDMSEDPQCNKLHTTPVIDRPVAANKNGTLANVFVYIKGGLEGKTFAPPGNAAVMDQKGCWFEPRVLGIQTGQELEVTNSDPVTHNIHPRAHVNREWNQSQEQGTAPLERKFAWPEVMIRVKCNIHNWMHAWIGVVGNPYFAVTGGDGNFELKNVPPGEYTIEAWQEELGTQEQHVTVAPSGKAEIAFTFKGE
jgi:plastocyanin